MAAQRNLTSKANHEALNNQVYKLLTENFVLTVSISNIIIVLQPVCDGGRQLLGW